MFQGSLANTTMFQGNLDNTTMFQGSLANTTMFQGNLDNTTMFQGGLGNTTIFQGNLDNTTMFQGNLANTTMFQGSLGNTTIFQGNLANTTMFQGSLANTTMFQGNLANTTMFQGGLDNTTMFQRSTNDTSITMFQGTLENSTNSHRNLDSNPTLHPVEVYFCLFVYLIITLGGFFGNLTTLLCISTNKNFWRHTYYYIASTALSDLLVCSILPLNIIHLATKEQTMSAVLCHLEAYGSRCFLYTSGLLIGCTGFCRYVQVVHSDRLEKFKKSWILVFCLLYAWLVPLMVMIPNFIKVGERVTFNKDVLVCQINVNGTNIITLSTCFIAIPLMILISYFYIHIFVFLRKLKRKIGLSNIIESSQQSKTRSNVSRITTVKNTGGVLQNTGENSQTRSSSRRKKLPKLTTQEKKLTLSIMVISITYIVIWMCFGILRLIVRTSKSPQVEVAATMAVRMSPLINVVISYSLNSRLRNSAVQIFSMCKTRNRVTST